MCKEESKKRGKEACFARGKIFMTLDEGKKTQNNYKQNKEGREFDDFLGRLWPY